PTGQAGALRLAIARALNVYNPADRAALKKAGLPHP
ncbi:30S ribosomal protein S9, partial [Bacteroides fragilis]|nr:30S ribosomal protein S9 [Bacteroides fragilis]